MKKTQHTPEEIKQYNKSFINFMKSSEEETGGEETVNELKKSTVVDKTEVRTYEE